MKSITLNLPYDLSAEEWKKVTNVFEQLDGWMNHSEYMCWYGTDDDEEYICASVEPSGLLLQGSVSDETWVGWVSKLCAKLSLALSREVYDAEI